jgi:hypothetical protein
MNRARETTAGKQVLDLADADDLVTGRFHAVE